MTDTFGLQIYNAAGNLQISDSYQNYQQIGSGTISSASVNSSPTSITYPTQPNGAYPLVFARPHSDGVYVGGCFFGTPTFGGGSNTINLISSGAYDYRIYGLTTAQLIDSSGFGMQVFDASGNVIYDSRAAAPRILATVTETMPYPSTGPNNPFYNPAVPITLTYTSFGSRPWFLVNNLTNYEYLGGFSIWAVAIDPSANTSSILLSNGDTNGSGAWYNYSADGGGYGYTYGFAGGQCIIPLAICY